MSSGTGDSLAAAHCQQHPSRPGIGICVECRAVVCAECSTQFEGINRCAGCLARLAPRAQTRRPFAEWGAGSVAGALASFALLFAGLWGLAQLFQP